VVIDMKTILMVCMVCILVIPTMSCAASSKCEVIDVYDMSSTITDEYKGTALQVICEKQLKVVVGDMVKVKQYAIKETPERR
jgi:hypothetical protein